MASAEQITANRLNAQHSTGPRTVEGKEVPSRNATRHGLASAATVLPDENAADLEALAERLTAERHPAGEH